MAGPSHGFAMFMSPQDSDRDTWRGPTLCHLDRPMAGGGHRQRGQHQGPCTNPQHSWPSGRSCPLTLSPNNSGGWGSAARWGQHLSLQPAGFCPSWALENSISISLCWPQQSGALAHNPLFQERDVEEPGRSCRNAVWTALQHSLCPHSRLELDLGSRSCILGANWGGDEACWALQVLSTGCCPSQPHTGTAPWAGARGPH